RARRPHRGWLPFERILVWGSQWLSKLDYRCGERLHVTSLDAPGVSALASVEAHAVTGFQLTRLQSRLLQRVGVNEVVVSVVSADEPASALGPKLYLALHQCCVSSQIGHARSGCSTASLERNMRTNAALSSSVRPSEVSQ